MVRKPSSSPLAALSAAAAALPGYGHAAETDVGYRYSYYVEDDLSAEKNLNGQEAARYEIETHQVTASGAVSNGWTGSAELMVETLSGATPWFVVPVNNQPVQVMSGATIQEERYALYGQLWRERTSGRRLGLAAGASTEDDYQAFSGGLEGQWDFDHKQSTFSAGGGVSFDTIRPTEGGSSRFPNRPTDEDKRTYQLYSGFSRVLTPQTIAQVSLSYGLDLGYLSDPYKLVQVEGATENDARPDSRSQFAIGARLRHYLPGLGTSLRADYRYYRDDWGVVSDTLELGSVSRVAEPLRLGVTLRWYQQSRADFYGAFFVERRDDGYHSSDYRLSPFGAVSGRISADYIGANWEASLAYERYSSGGNYALQNVPVESPGLVDFAVYSLAFSYGF